MRVIVLGGAGNFGARIVRALRGDPTIDLLVAGRRLIAVPGAEDVPCALVDIGAPDFTQQLRALSPELVIHCVSPFPCMGFLTLAEFAPEFARWKITTRMEEVAA
jgi:nucleoside-diphosphate-sugar epimerase